MSYFRRKRVVVPVDIEKQKKYVKPIGVLIPFNEPHGIFKLSYISKDQVYSNLRNLLLTAKGERYMLPTFGTNIRIILFENISTEEEFLDSLKKEINSAISEWMPYVKVVRINIFLSDDQGVNSDHALRIEMVVNLTETNINLPIQIFIDETGNLRIKEALNNG